MRTGTLSATTCPSATRPLLLRQHEALKVTLNVALLIPALGAVTVHLHFVFSLTTSFAARFTVNFLLAF
jgi:hypothetical protein